MIGYNQVNVDCWGFVLHILCYDLTVCPVSEHGETREKNVKSKPIEAYVYARVGN